MKKMEDYIIPGTNMINFTAYSRENIPKDPPKFKVGDEVIFTIQTTITRVGKDCDGTTLYGIDMVDGGWDEESLAEVKP